MAISLDLKSLDLKKLKSINPVQAGGVLALLVALWMAWQGFQISAAYRLEAGAASARSGLAEKLGPVTKLAIAQMEARGARVGVVAALQKGDLEAAKAAVKEGWKEAEAVEIHAPDLDAAYADPALFGYGKLGLLETAMQDRKTSLRVVMDGGQASIGLAMPLQQGETITHLIYVRVSAAPLVEPVLPAAPAGGYIA